MTQAPRQWICQSARCGTRYEGTDKACPQCGGTAAPASAMKVRGVAALVAGLFLFGMMSMLELALWQQLLGWDQPGGSRFTGSSTDGLVVLALFVAISLFGLVAILAGVAMIRTGRRNPVLLVWAVPPLLVIVMIVVLILGGFVLKG